MSRQAAIGFFIGFFLLVAVICTAIIASTRETYAATPVDQSPVNTLVEPY